MITNALKCRIALAPIMLSLLVAGCVDKANPDNVDKRASERWSYLSAHQAEKAYDYLSPGFRSTQSRETYAASMNSRPVQWKGGKFKSKECDAERCKVEIDVTYSLTIPGVGGKPVESSSTQTETWLLVDGQWFFLPK